MCFALSVLAGSVAILFAWLLGIHPLRSLYIAGAAVKPNTAVTLGASAISLLIVCRYSRKNWATPSAARALGFLAFLVGILTLLQHASGLDFRIDQLFFDASRQVPQQAFAGRMAAITALESALMGMTLVLADVETRRGFRPAEPMAIATAAVALMALLGYIYGGIPAAGPQHGTQIPIPTALAFLLLALGFLALRRDTGWMKSLLSERAGGMLARRLLPFVVIVPLCLGFLRMFEGWFTGYSVAGVTSIVAVITMVVFATITVGAAKALNEADDRTVEAEAARRSLALQRSAAVAGEQVRREDFTRALAQEQLNARDQVLSHVSHELRTPLAAAHQFVGILLDGIAGDLQAEQREYLEIVRRNLKQLQTMIGDLLETTRARGGMLAIDSYPLEVTGIVNDMIRTLRSSAGEKGIALQVIDSDPPLVWADAARVRQILTHLLENAVKFMASGSITVAARVHSPAPEFVCVSITDTGPGIPPESIERIFDPLYQDNGNVDSGRKRLGLGLYICRELAVRMGGKLWVESRLGSGSTFYLLIPVFDQEAGMQGQRV